MKFVVFFSISVLNKLLLTQQKKKIQCFLRRIRGERERERERERGRGRERDREKAECRSRLKICVFLFYTHL